MRGDAAKLGLRDRGAFFNRTYDFDEEREAMAKGDYRRQGWLLGNHDLADPGHAPPGRSILHAALMADGRLWQGDDEESYRARKRELEAYLVDRLAEAIPDLRERIEVIETGTPHTMERYSSNPLGSIYGYASSPAAHSIHRPGARSSVPGLYLAGAWTFPGPGFSGTMHSGHRTAGLVLEDFEGGGSGPPSPVLEVFGPDRGAGSWVCCVGRSGERVPTARGAGASPPRAAV